MQNQVMLTNEAQRMAEVPLMITFDGEWAVSYTHLDVYKRQKQKLLPP